MSKPLAEYTPEEQRAEIRAIIAYFDARGWDWVSLVSYHAAVFTGHWPVPRPQCKGGSAASRERI